MIYYNGKNIESKYLFHEKVRIVNNLLTISEFLFIIVKICYTF